MLRRPDRSRRLLSHACLLVCLVCVVLRLMTSDCLYPGLMLETAGIGPGTVVMRSVVALIYYDISCAISLLVERLIVIFLYDSCI